MNHESPPPKPMIDHFFEDHEKFGISTELLLRKIIERWHVPPVKALLGGNVDESTLKESTLKAQFVTPGMSSAPTC